METTERIVEAYVRYIKGWATIPNVKCPGQYEIDLLAIDPKSNNKYHIESGISLSSVLGELTGTKFDVKELRVRVHTLEQRRTIGFFLERKFNPPKVLDTLKNYGFTPGNYKKIIISWGWTDEAAETAKKNKIELWHFPNLMSEIAESLKKKKIHFTDDVLRTIYLFTRGVEVKEE
jgi:hypothetical protein